MTASCVERSYRRGGDIQRCALMLYHPDGMDDIPPAADDIQGKASMIYHPDGMDDIQRVALI